MHALSAHFPNTYKPKGSLRLHSLRLTHVTISGLQRNLTSEPISFSLSLCLFQSLPLSLKTWAQITFSPGDDFS